MRRVAVIGCGGSKKRTLARTLGAALGIEVVHGDFLGRTSGERARGEAWRRLEGQVLPRDWIWRFPRDDRPRVLARSGAPPPRRRS